MSQFDENKFNVPTKTIQEYFYLFWSWTWLILLAGLVAGGTWDLHPTRSE
jgi:hypothetical protein